jgi:hypothetical protein
VVVPPPPPPFNPIQEKCQPPSTIPRYTINPELLKSMTKKLRRPGDNIMKIPRRKDMIIPKKCHKN